MPEMKVSSNKRVYVTEMCKHLHRYMLSASVMWCSQCGAFKKLLSPEVTGRLATEWIKPHLKAHKNSDLGEFRKVQL